MRNELRLAALMLELPRRDLCVVKVRPSGVAEDAADATAWWGFPVRGRLLLSRAATWLRRIRQTHHSERRGRGEHPQRHVHVRDERRELCSESRLPGRRRSRRASLCGTAEVTIASTKAIESTAPVFCRSVLAPAATPRRLAGTTPIIAAVFGLLNIPEPTPTTAARARFASTGCGRPGWSSPRDRRRVTSMPMAASARDPCRSA